MDWIIDIPLSWHAVAFSSDSHVQDMNREPSFTVMDLLVKLEQEQQITASQLEQVQMGLKSVSDGQKALGEGFVTEVDEIKAIQKAQGRASTLRMEELERHTHAVAELLKRPKRLSAKRIEYFEQVQDNKGNNDSAPNCSIGQVEEEEEKTELAGSYYAQAKLVVSDLMDRASQFCGDRFYRVMIWIAWLWLLAFACVATLLLINLGGPPFHTLI
jgi:hypothetical protein